MTSEQAALVAMAIDQNENRFACELTDLQIEMYLLDAGHEDSEENVKLVREA